MHHKSWTFIGIQKYLLTTLTVSPLEGLTFIVKMLAERPADDLTQKIIMSSKGKHNHSPRLTEMAHISSSSMMCHAGLDGFSLIRSLFEFWFNIYPLPHILESKFLQLFSFTKNIHFLFLLCIFVCACVQESPSEAMKGFRSPRSEVPSDCEPPDLGACD